MRYRVPLVLGILGVFVIVAIAVPARYLFSAKAQGPLQPMTVGSLSPLLRTSHALGHDTSNRTLQLSVGLSMRHQGQLDTLLHDLYNPASPQYRHFLSVAEFTQQFGPTAEQQQRVSDYLKQQGFTITNTYPNHLLIDFSGSQALAERVFGVSINTYRDPAGRTFFANANVPMLPAYIANAVQSVWGLDNSVQYSHASLTSHHLAASTLSKSASNCPTAGQSGSGASQIAYIPSQLSKAYNYDGLHSAGLQGEGQTVGVFELDGYSASDIQTYTQCFGGASVPLQNVIVDGYNGAAGAGAVEVELDIEMIISQAQHLANLKVYEAPNTTQGYNDEFARIVSDRVPVTSVSWGDCETTTGQAEAQQENTYFKEAAAQGQTILVASGDSGSETCFQQTYDFSLVADDPATQPYVTAVGGTTLSVNSANSYQSEHVWNGGFLGGAGGGGISKFWPTPSWQTGPGTKNSYSNGMRETPDVSLNADPATGYPVYCTAGSNCSGSGGILGGSSGGWLTVGGTSAAAPMWAAMIALANEQAAKAGKGLVGFLNPAIYRIASGSAYGSAFHDITPPSDASLPSNNDEIGINGGAYPVTAGYDMATGWGSFNATELAGQLVG